MSEGSRTGRRLARSPQDAAAETFLLAVAAIALWQSAGLAAGTLTQLGPAMVPRGLAVRSPGPAPPCKAEPGCPR